MRHESSLNSSREAARTIVSGVPRSPFRRSPDLRVWRLSKPHGLEVFTRAGRRRTWSDENKARIVAEIVASGETVSAVARRHGFSPQQLFGWRRELQASQPTLPQAEELQFVPAVLDAAPSSSSVRRQRKMPLGAGMIEVEIDGVTVRVGRGADAKIVGGAASIESWHVIGPTVAVRVMVATKPTDFRKGERAWKRWCARP